MKTIILLCLTAFCFTSCEVLNNISSGASIIYTGDGVEMSGMNPAGGIGATSAGYNLKTKTAYIRYADGRVSNLKITGGGIGAGGIVLVLENGDRITINKSGAVLTENPFGPPAVSTASQQK